MASKQEKQMSGASKSISSDGATLGRLVKHAVAVLAILSVAAGLLAGCSDAGGNTFDGALSLTAEEYGPTPALDGSSATGDESYLHDLWYQELRDGPDVQHLGMARMLNEVGIIDLLSSYIVNVPNGAYFLPNFELQAGMSASTWAYREDEEMDEITHEFEQQVLIAIDGAALNRLYAPHEPVELHEAFFEVFEQCGRDSPWPEVKMAERQGTGAGDVLFRDPELGISDYEYRELLHVCGRYAATYPTLDPVLRDELLAPQRAYFAQEILDRIDNELPLVEVPPEYQDEIDDLRANGW